MIPPQIVIKNGELPDNPGVYFYYDQGGTLLYIGKATSLKRRVGSYFTKAHDNRIAELVSRVAKIGYIQTPTVIEALVLEANQIKAHKPYYNILQRDDKSFLYLTVTNEDFPRPILMRGLELERMGINPFQPTLSPKAKKKFLTVFGPYTSGASLRRALDLIRRVIPWSDCQPPSITGTTKACFNVHIKKCPGVCAGLISKEAYRKTIRHFILFFEGKKRQLVREMKKEMNRASKEMRYEDAVKYRNAVFSLEHIQDVALITHEEPLPYIHHADDVIDLDGRIEAYDISNISGTSAVGSMVVFAEGKPNKNEYRRFRIKTVQGSNDVAMMEEVLRRRLARARNFPKSWPLPEILVIDGGEVQVNRVQEVLDESGVYVPVVGIAKGFDRKQDRLVFDRSNTDLARTVTRGKEIFQKARDEAHRFAVAYHRKVRARTSIPRSRRKQK